MAALPGPESCSWIQLDERALLRVGGLRDCDGLDRQATRMPAVRSHTVSRSRAKEHSDTQQATHFRDRRCAYQSHDGNAQWHRQTPDMVQVPP
jgi:hypothetical protein